ncbi:hypothetical protein EJ05DRAFT_398307 [Pseudovirgaria hyperparasitica]|uniref:Uncharacterized protein n=1 Tax=Pseudovirgaria hyperparasitica TaxID=470096 RepID=A0A6A6W4C5_9PEZI|nr:uncharacterized protein EJ05DRAFT_398307 [Pseudovirgaria hyperparasitica]KAF2757722.1 hypothetical protein EJ05DRAFT_398307 [Pseudovirgaria hyperparasitica]
MTTPATQVSSSTEAFGPPSRSNTGSSTFTTCSQIESPSEVIDPSQPSNTRPFRSTASGLSSIAEQSFLGALSSRVRGRSRNRSQTSSRNQSRSPMPPPSRMASDRILSSSPVRPRASRQQSEYSGSTLVSDHKVPNRQTTSDSHQSSHSRENFHWQGRHSNSWLFNDFSVIGTIKSVTRRNRRVS